MEFADNYSLTQLFIDKHIKIFQDGQYLFSIQVPTVRQMMEDEEWSQAYYFFTLSPSVWKRNWGIEGETNWDCLKFICFKLGLYKEYMELLQVLEKGFKCINPDWEVDYKNGEMKIQSVTITSEIWNYVIYLLKLSYGEKITQPPIFKTPEEKAFYLQQQKAEERIRRIKQSNNEERDKDGLIKVFLAIVYSFPALTFDYLFDQTMAQIQWLHKMAVGEVSYSFNEKVAAAGNMKKGKKLDFFIK